MGQALAFVPHRDAPTLTASHGRMRHADTLRRKRLHSGTEDAEPRAAGFLVAPGRALRFAVPTDAWPSACRLARPQFRARVRH
jgi:hypothetical protein